MNHELGHTMGLVDLYDQAMSTYPQTYHYTGDFSMMGFIAGNGPEYFAWERWVLRWVSDDQVRCAGPGQTSATLTPVESTGGTKMVVVPTSADRAVVVESRAALGFDSALPRSGLLMYTVEPSQGTGHGTVKVLPIDDSDTQKDTAPLGVGQSLTYDGVTVTFTSQDAAGDHVDVTY